MNSTVEACPTCGNTMDWEAKRSNADRIASLLPGDFFHAKGITVGGLIFLTTAVSETTISSHELSSPNVVSRFDRATGHMLPDEFYTPGDRPWMIDSVEPLPIAVHQGLLDINRRNRLRPLENVMPGLRENLEAFDRAHEHYSAHAFTAVSAGDSQ
jgi:hypothetical protein